MRNKVNKINKAEKEKVEGEVKKYSEKKQYADINKGGKR